MKTINILLFISMVVFFFSCNNNKRVIDRINSAKKVGNENPQLALAMLDSIDAEIRDYPLSVIMKYDLTRLRLQDKADIIPTSDIVAKRLLAYYEKNGTKEEMQEVYYYAGSVYRDLQDSPRALEYFLKSSDVEGFEDTCDSLMLRNAYSNLHYVFHSVQDYKNCLEYAKKELQVSQNLGNVEITELMHLGVAYTVNKNPDSAMKVYEHVLDTIISNKNLQDNIETISHLLLFLSFHKKAVHAQKCYNLYKKFDIPQSYNDGLIAYGEYCKLMGKRDSAIYAFNQVLKNENCTMTHMYDASRQLFSDNIGDLVPPVAVFWYR